MSTEKKLNGITDQVDLSTMNKSDHLDAETTLKLMLLISSLPKQDLVGGDSHSYIVITSLLYRKGYPGHKF